MNNKRNIADFLELMNHEFPAIPLTLNQMGYKVDGNDGIKKHCKLNDLKSVDYFCEQSAQSQNTRCLLIEFSDLSRQQSSILDKIVNIAKSDLPKSQKTQIKKDYYKTIQKELVTKYKDSIHILNNMSDYIDDIPPALAGHHHTFIIVVAPIDKAMPANKRVDIVRFLDELKDKVAQSIPDALYHRVRVSSLKAFSCQE